MSVGIWIPFYPFLLIAVLLKYLILSVCRSTGILPNIFFFYILHLDMIFIWRLPLQKLKTPGSKKKKNPLSPYQFVLL